jgi:hypothetical protein
MFDYNTTQAWALAFALAWPWVWQLTFKIEFYFRAQFGENQSIFNTPNPRLMNVSLVKGISFKRKHYGEGGWGERKNPDCVLNMMIIKTVILSY